MSTMNVSLPEALKTFVEERVSDGHFSNSGEYVRELIRQDEARQKLRRLMVEGLASPSVGQADSRYWSAKRRAVRAALPRRRA